MVGDWEKVVGRQEVGENFDVFHDGVDGLLSMIVLII